MDSKGFGKGLNWDELLAEGSALALALAAKKDKIAELLGKLYDNQTGKLKVVEWPRRLRSLGRMIKAFTKGDYKNISPFFWVNMSVSFTYLSSNFKNTSTRNKLINLGILEDLTVIAFMLETLGGEIRKFEMWEVDQHVKSIELT